MVQNTEQNESLARCARSPACALLKQNFHRNVRVGNPRVFVRLVLEQVQRSLARNHHAPAGVTLKIAKVAEWLARFAVDRLAALEVPNVPHFDDSVTARGENFRGPERSEARLAEWVSDEIFCRRRLRSSQLAARSSHLSLIFTPISAAVWPISLQMMFST